MQDARSDGDGMKRISFSIATALLCSAALALGAGGSARAWAADSAATLLKERHMSIGARTQATRAPRSETDQALVDGWPLYRTPRGQASFNDAMATLKATETAPPAPAAFRGCPKLQCALALPRITGEGWIPPGRIWVSPTEYVLFVKSPRNRDGRPYSRRSIMGMKYFVFHEFHNGTLNTDMFDTISSHSGGVFVPFYMGKAMTDAAGRRFVIVVQIAPHDVHSIHASNMGSAGPGIEVAKNSAEPLEPLQGHAGILVATMVKTAAPLLNVVNHRGNEGRPMLDMHNQRLAGLRAQPDAAPIALPFVAASPQLMATATGQLGSLIRRPGVAPIAAAPNLRPARMEPSAADAGPPVLIGPIRPAVRPACPPLPGGPPAAACRQRVGSVQ
jgi:hypothetical protein